MTPREEQEIVIYRQIEQVLKENRDALLTELVPENCNCKEKRMRRTFRCPGAFQINMLLESLEQLRVNK